MRVAAIQSDIAWEDPAENFARCRQWIARAAAADARVVVLPEMFAYGFSMATERIREPEGGASAEFLLRAAADHGLWVMGSAPELAPNADKPRNTLLVASPGGALCRYHKIHPFTFASEDDHYDAGDQLVTVDIEGVRCSLFICYDLRFANEFWVRAPHTDCYIVVANWPQKRREHWTTLLRARALENQAYVVGVNRVGRGGGLDYSGDTRIFDPWGEALGAAAHAETMVLAEVDPQVVADARSKFPVLADRRP